MTPLPNDPKDLVPLTLALDILGLAATAFQRFYVLGSPYAPLIRRNLARQLSAPKRGPPSNLAMALNCLLGENPHELRHLVSKDWLTDPLMPDDAAELRHLSRHLLDPLVEAAQAPQRPADEPDDEIRTFGVVAERFLGLHNPELPSLDELEALFNQVDRIIRTLGNRRFVESLQIIADAVFQIRLGVNAGPLTQAVDRINTIRHLIKWGLRDPLPRLHVKREVTLLYWAISMRRGIDSTGAHAELYEHFNQLFARHKGYWLTW